ASEESFRSDLFYRLNVVPRVPPPLRGRTGDVPVLVRHSLDRTAAKDLSFAPPAMEALERYGWPGNVRELQNLVERLAVLKGSGEIALADLPAPIRAAAAAAPPAAAVAPPSDPATALPPEGIDLYAALAELEDRLINEALERSGGNKNQAAKILKLNRTTLVEKLKKRAKADNES